MALILHEQDTGFLVQFAEFLGKKRSLNQNIDAKVATILSHVQEQGDKALSDYSMAFDGVDFSQFPMRIPKEEIVHAAATIDAKTMAALRFAHQRITDYHRQQMPQNISFTDPLGVNLGWRWIALESAGLYIPGGSANYPSSVLMSAIPARIAGVERIVMVVPTPKGILNPLVLAAAHISSIDEIYRIGGAQAIAALAFGTETIQKVDKIVGPGNAYVASAKKQVFGTVGIDMIAGPSEIVIIADNHNNPDWIAADLLAQAEHDAAAQSILITDCPIFAHAVNDAVTRQLIDLPRQSIATASWKQFGAILILNTITNAPYFVNQLAPEHLQIALEKPDPLLETIRHAGAIFLGSYTPEAIGDYVGGSNHILPTARTARFSSPLSVLDYMKRSSITRLGLKQLQQIGPQAIRLAQIEGLDAHAHSISIRLNSIKS